MPRIFESGGLRILLALSLFIITEFLTVPISFGFASRYYITQLTHNDNSDEAPEINENGYVVWSRWHDEWAGFPASPEYEIFLYDGTTTTQLPGLRYHDRYPKINNRGYVVWRGQSIVNEQDNRIFLYDGTNTTQLTNNNSPWGNWSPQINDNGYVVWHGWDGSDYEIFRYGGTNIARLTNNANSDRDPQINDNGYVVWQGWDGSDWEIFLYDGANTTQLTNNNNTDSSPQINDNGYVVWHSGAGSDLDIFLYDGMNTTQLINDNYNDWSPQINDNGYVVWHGCDDLDCEIFRYDGTNIARLTINDDDDRNPQINDNGYVVWQGWDGSDWEIFLALPAVVSARPEVLEFPWWKSEEYWGFWDPRIPPQFSPPFDVDIPETKPVPCPQCSFSKTWRPDKMPSHLPHLYQERFNIFQNSGKTQFSRRNAERLITLFKSIPTGQRYTESLRDSVTNAIAESKDQRKDGRSAADQLLQAMNAVELDWRVPSLSAQKVKTGKDLTVNFRGVASVTFREVKQPGEISLSVMGGLPAVVKNSRAVWPVATYHFDFTGQLSEHVDISFYFGGHSFKGGISSLYLFEWDGKSYRDITTVVDRPGKVITGRTNKLGSFVIMSPVFRN
ncbi:MAG: hypothetical protein OES46_08405 [Gammaproteobacteria bacterium]|nr:hypothetical protein [Gammaproteobacteria bacterium]